MAILVLAYSGLSHLQGFPFVSNRNVHENWPGAPANLLFTILCSVATFVVFDRVRKVKSWYRIDVRFLFQLTAFFALAFCVCTNLPIFDQFLVDHLGLVRKTFVAGLPLKFFLFIGVASTIAMIAGGAVSMIEIAFGVSRN